MMKQHKLPMRLTATPAPIRVWPGISRPGFSDSAKTGCAGCRDEEVGPLYQAYAVAVDQHAKPHLHEVQGQEIG